MECASRLDAKYTHTYTHTHTCDNLSSLRRALFNNTSTRSLEREGAPSAAASARNSTREAGYRIGECVALVQTRLRVCVFVCTIERQAHRGVQESTQRDKEAARRLCGCVLLLCAGGRGGES